MASQGHNCTAVVVSVVLTILLHSHGLSTMLLHGRAERDIGQTSYSTRNNFTGDNTLHEHLQQNKDDNSKQLLEQTGNVEKVHSNLCPGECTCNTNSENQGLYVDCRARSLNAIPRLPRNTRIVDLSHNRIADITPGIFAGLEQLSVINIQSNEIQYLTNETFGSIPNLTRLILSDLKLKRIAECTFCKLDNLRELDLSYNRHLTMRMTSPLVKAFKGISRKIESLNIARVNIRNDRNTFVLQRHFFKGLQSTKLKTLDISGNNLAILMPGFSFNLNSIEHIKIAMNYIVNIPYIDILTISKTIRTFDASYQSYPRDRNMGPLQIRSRKKRDVLQMPLIFPKKLQKRDSQALFEHCSEMWPAPPHLEELYLHHLSRGIDAVHRYTCLGDNSLRIADISFANIFKWNGPIIGLNKLQYLYMQGNFFNYFALDGFDYLPRLEALYLSQNNMGNLVINHDSEGRLFANLTTMKTLDIAANNIEYMSENAIFNMVNLSNLNMSFNQIYNFSLDLSRHNNIKNINLSHNEIHLIAAKQRQMLDDLKKRTNYTLDLTGNALTCGCGESLLSLKWMTALERREMFPGFFEYKCVFDNGSVLAFDQINVEELWNDCHRVDMTPYVISGSLLLCIIMVLAIGKLVHYNRWTLRYWYYVLRKSYRQKRLMEMHNEVIIEYDAFVSFHADSTQWVVDDLCSFERDNDFQFCIHLRDWMPGTYIQENIVQSVDKSRKTLLLVTKEFSTSQYCLYEMYMARNVLFDKGVDVLVLILLDPAEVILAQPINKVLKHLIQRKSYIQWPGTHFWSNLKAALAQDEVRPLTA
ncbi:unnamed protein product [Owenia fusiformis]|uniref:Uncharacterized protein n=1 Tax=Owenia fusiformis TaxID=6347 RepID=A0A8J1UDB3_OWEFU|nr:unnamed protein product [Owenia fusiformis]